METPSVVTPTTPVTASAPATAPAPATPTPTPAPATAPMVNMDAGSGTPMMENGGSTDSGGGFFKNINWIETGALILGFAGLYYLIYYYRYKLNQDKLINNEMQRQIDEIKMNLQTKMNGKYKTM